MPNGTMQGGCFCGAVRFEIDPPTKWCANCHCTMCRRMHGAPLVTWVGVPKDQFRLVAGEENLVRFRSSDAARRSFCRACGTTMLFEGDRWAEEVHVARACIDGEIDRAVQAHCFWDDRAGWYPHAPDGLPRLGGPSGTEPVESPEHGG